MILTLADANRVIAGAIEKANQIGAKINIAVCDAAKHTAFEHGWRHVGWRLRQPGQGDGLGRLGSTRAAI